MHLDGLFVGVGANYAGRMFRVLESFHHFGRPTAAPHNDNDCLALTLIEMLNQPVDTSAYVYCWYLKPSNAVCRQCH